MGAPGTGPQGALEDEPMRNRLIGPAQRPRARRSARDRHDGTSETDTAAYRAAGPDDPELARLPQINPDFDEFWR